MLDLKQTLMILVVDHNPHLLQMLDGCDMIKLEMNDEVAKVVV